MLDTRTSPTAYHEALLSFILSTSQRLYSYFNGDNADDESFDFTTPMVTYFEWDKDGEGFKKGYAFGYWLPQDKQVRERCLDPWFAPLDMSFRASSATYCYSARSAHARV